MAGSKPTAVHFTLIFFVMLSLFLGVFAYMFYTDYAEASAKLIEADKQAQTDKQAIANALQTNQEAKDALGYDFTGFGSSDDPNSVLGALAVDVKTVAGILAAQPQKLTVREVMAALAAQLKNRAEVTQQAQDSTTSAQQNFKDQTDQQLAAVTAAQASQQDSEKQLRDAEAKAAEQAAELNNQVTMWQGLYREAQGKYETERDTFEQAKEDWSKARKQLEGTIDHQKEQIAQLENISFEAPDGEVILVENATRSVWINKGEQDYLRPQVTFSVYRKEHRGIARSTADVKAKIEVVKVEGRTAQCQILDEDLTRPIAPGDPIYTPLWQSGMVEKIAFVGIIDLDGDGVSDRELLQEMMDVNHSKIKLQVLDDGSRLPADARLDVDSKFLVEGVIPDPNDFAGVDEKTRHIEDMMEQRRLLMDEAKEFGVQVISLNEFLTWVGYKNQQRVFRPGENRPFNLGAGAASQGVGENFKDRTSPGTTSKLFQPNSRATQRFGGGR
ncbi:MAG: hypothetical protein ACK5Q5_22285 [Planctomycetaceae bacterium]